MAELEFNIFEKGGARTVLLGLIGTGESVPETMVDVTYDGNLIPENLQDVAPFVRGTVSGEFSDFYLDFPSFYSTSATVLNRYLLTPFTIFQDEFNTNPVQLEPLFYKYELKFDHRSSATNPGGNLFVTDNDGNIIPRFYYSLFIEPSYRIPSESLTQAALGAFILESSQVDSARARAALGETIWGEVFSTTNIRERFLWERENKELVRPLWYDEEGFTNEISGIWSRIDDGRYSREDFMEFYIDQDGFWGQAVDVEGRVVYTTLAGGTVTRGYVLSGVLSSTPTIGDLISDKYLDGDNLFLPDVPLRVTLLLPEFLVNQDDQTYWVQYNKFVRYTLSGEVVEEYSPNHREVINAGYLMREGVDYTLNYTTKQVNIDTDFETRWGKFETFYVKKNRQHTIAITAPFGNSRSGWFVEVTKGDFRAGSQIYETHRLIDSLGKARDWSQGTVYPCISDNGLNLTAISKERAMVIDQRTLKVSRKPLFFWSGPRDGGVRDSNYGYFSDDTESAGFDTGEFPADNPWPRYIPPNLLDWHYLPAYSFYPSSPTSDAGYSHGITIYKNGSRLPNSIIDTWDFWNGIIFLKEVINPDDVIEISYLYEQNKAPLGFLNLNPIYAERLYSPTEPTFSHF